tara:strand:- start:7525 stop:8154 length:630 start_codon:yes stop_codon:yes gene_type:complete
MKKQISITRTIMQILLYTVLLLGIYQVGSAQNKVALSVQVDPKITAVGDDAHGIPSGLTNILVKSRWQGKQQEWGYMHVAPTFEYATLNPDLPAYKRYAVEVGYTFNQFFDNWKPLDLWLFEINPSNFEVGGYIDYGILERGLAKQGLGFGVVLGYEFFDGFKGIATLQYVDRQDFEVLYNIKSQFKHSVQVGFEINILDTDPANWKRF